MAEFSNYYMNFLQSLFANIKKFFENFFGLFVDIFYNDQKQYFKLIGDAAFNNPNWNILDWVAFIIVTILNIGLVVVIIILLHYLNRRYIKFRRKEVEKDDLLDEVSILNQKVIDLIEEKNKILAMRVSQIGGGFTAADRNNLQPVGGGYVSNKNKKKKEKEEVLDSRFTKLIQVDETFFKAPKITIMNADDTLDLPGLINRFINYSASQLHLCYSKEIIARYFAAMATTKVLILEGISGTGKTSLPYAMGKFFDKPTSIISVQPSWRDRSELLGYLNEFTKKFNETEFLKAVYESNYSDTVNTIVLDEMNLARIEYYFAEFLSVMEMPDKNEWKIDLVPSNPASDPKKLINGKLLIPQNLWFVGTANKDDSTFTITDKVYDRAMPIVINNKADFIDAPYTEQVHVTYEYLDELFEEAIKNIEISQKSIAAFSKLDEYIQHNFKIAFGNRIMKQIKRFVPAYVACGFSELDGLDYMLKNKILRKFESLNLTFLRKELEELSNMLDKLFGKGKFKVSQDYIEELKKMI